MKSKRGGIIFIFIGISVAAHALLLFLPGTSTDRAPVSPKEYIPVSFNTREQQQPAVDELKEELPAAPEAEPVQETLPEPVSQPEPVTEPQAEPQPETAAVSDPVSEPLEQEVSNAPAGQPADISSPPPPAQPTANPFEDLMHRVNELKDSVYPLKAKKRKYQGTVIVELTLDSDGNLTDAVIVQKCRYQILDDAAMHLIDLVFIDPYPHNMGRDVVLKMPITFKLL